MLGNLFSNSKKTAEIPDNLRLYAIGDIHGRLDCLSAMLTLIEEDKASARLASDAFGGADCTTALIFLGDYIDRGADSKKVIDRLIEIRKEQPNCVFLKGNHEAAFLDFLADPRANAEWMHWGGAETLQSYGLANVWTRDEEDLRDELATVLPEDHLMFLKSLPLTYSSGDYLFVHAGLKPGVALDEQEEKDLLWIRGEFHNARGDDRPEQTIIHGHHPVKKPHDAGWRINVDTGAYWSGSLTAVALEGKARRFLSTDLAKQTQDG